LGQGVHLRAHARQQEAQAALRASMKWWGGYQQSAGRDRSEAHRQFFFAFGVDVMTAKALDTSKALDLAVRVNQHLARAAS